MADYAWIELENGRSAYRRIRHEPSKRSHLPCPMVISDSFDAPVKSMADGRMYTSKAALRATYRPDGNPRGIAFEEVGNDAFYCNPAPKPRPKPDRAAIKEAVQKAEAAISSGDIPPEARIPD